MVVRIGVFLSGLAGVLLLLWASVSLLTGPEWFLVLLLYAAILWGAALAVIWLGVLVVHVIVKAVRVTDDAGRIR